MLESYSVVSRRQVIGDGYYYRVRHVKGADPLAVFVGSLDEISDVYAYLQVVEDYMSMRLTGRDVMYSEQYLIDELCAFDVKTLWELIHLIPESPYTEYLRAFILERMRIES